MWSGSQWRRHGSLYRPVPWLPLLFLRRVLLSQQDRLQGAHRRLLGLLRQRHALLVWLYLALLLWLYLALLLGLLWLYLALLLGLLWLGLALLLGLLRLGRASRSERRLLRGLHSLQRLLLLRVCPLHLCGPQTASRSPILWPSSGPARDLRGRQLLAPRGLS